MKMTSDDNFDTQTTKYKLLHPTNSKDITVTVQGVPYKKHVILADVNIPSKFSIDRNRNNLFFCINADQLSDQSFHSVVLNLETGSTAIVPGIRNGFASAVDQNSGAIYLGGSDGIFSYNYQTGDVDKPALLSGVDIFDMYYKDDLYFVDTANQNLNLCKDGKMKTVFPPDSRYLIHHCALDHSNTFYFVSSSGLYKRKKDSTSATLLDNSGIQYRGVAFDIHGDPYFVAQDGIYVIKEVLRPQLIYAVDNAFGLAFDKNNNLIYSDERSVMILLHLFNN